MATGRPDTVAEMLEHVSGLLDAFEVCLRALESHTGKPAPVSGGKAVQQDLKALAAGLAADPDLDARLYAYLG